jgi:hypothetical protein
MERNSMAKPDAAAYFRGADGYNCAQAVLRAYANHIPVDQACLDRFSHFGGGKAPGGECGALFAAKAMLADPAARRRVEEAFAEVAGATQCRAIRKLRRVSCSQCVQTAADELFLQLCEGQSLCRPADGECSDLSS